LEARQPFLGSEALSRGWLNRHQLRAPSGPVIRRAALAADEVRVVDGRSVTTPGRAAFDLGRRGTVNSAVARLDALARATGMSVGDVAEVASRHRGARGVAVEYDGDHHRTDRRQYVRDVRRWALLEELGWLIVRVVMEDHPVDVLRRVRRAIASRESAVR
jgi:hypothetical protein